MSLPPALVLAAGLGTRLFPLTASRAKPAAPVAGVPLIVRIVTALASAGAREVVVNLHHRPESIARVLGDGSDLGVRVRYSWEGSRVLGSAGGPRRALPLMADEEFLIVNGDTMTDLALAPLVVTHRATGARVTMALVPNREPRRYGGVLLDEQQAVVGFTRRGDARPSWHFVGLQAVQASVFAGLEDGVLAESVGGIYRSLISAAPGAVRGWATDGEFVDVGTPADYLRTNAAFAAREGRALPIVGTRSRLSPSARIADSVLWDDVTVGDDVCLERCVIADRVEIPAGARYVEKAIARVAEVHAGALPAHARVERGLVIADLDPYASSLKGPSST